MKFNNVNVMNFEGAFRGLRNPLESWSKSDSFFGLLNVEYDTYKVDDVIFDWIKTNHPDVQYGSEKYNSLWELYFNKWYEEGILKEGGDLQEVVCLGPKDMDLAQRMITAGPSDRKFLRQIMVSVDITGPLYWQNSFCQ